MLIDSEINVNLWGHVHHFERLDAIYNHEILKTKNLMSLIVGTGGNKEGITKSKHKLISNQWDPSKNAILLKEQGFVTLSIYPDRLQSTFYSTSKKRIRDDVTMYHVKKVNNFPAYLWVFLILLILFACFILVWIGKSIWIKMKKKEVKTSNEDNLLIEHE